MANGGSVPSITGRRISAVGADEIDFKIHGQEMQFVEIELDPGESAVAEAGAMMFKDASRRTWTRVFGDGSKPPDGGFFGKLAAAGKRLLTGESLFMTVFTHQGQRQGARRVRGALSRHDPAVQAHRLRRHAHRQKDAFLCAAKGVSIGIFFQRKIMTGLFGGEGFIMQKLEGDG